eukprot:TRINITY_DN2741_c0_g1_i3.p1 TRINITY_DN2741_c0_g1~~TRINITY_DN2741_c0_g1_i3.p1  ORF type:complete len:192 (+),score=46.50 TRINITY_DN2741_c0_g1_i3:469-1044(+)
MFPEKEDGTIKWIDIDPIIPWKEMEKLVASGKVKSLGVSNFNHKQILAINKESSIPISVVQCECHPYFPQQKLLNFCKEQGITFIAYAPLGAPDYAQPGSPALLEDEAVAAIAKNYGKTTAQVLLRFHIDRGCAVIPKSVTPSRIEENLKVFDFKLTPEDLQTLIGLDKDHRYYRDDECATSPQYPFKEEY